MVSLIVDLYAKHTAVFLGLNRF